MMTSLREIIELYLQWSNFLENVMPTLSKETKTSASMFRDAVIYWTACFCTWNVLQYQQLFGKKRLSAEDFQRKTHQQIENEKGQV